MSRAMSVSLGTFLGCTAAAAALLSCAYCVLSIWAGIRFVRAQASSSLSTRPVSILKPLKGADREMYEALRSHCLLDYPEYEILLGVTEDEDPAVPLVHKLIAEFPHRQLRLIHCRQRLGVNGKVSSLAQLASAARFDLLVVNDSDIRVSQAYLRDIVSELDEPRTGLVT
ncbi:MAG: glycosyltransferase, partial [Acidobacteria bacterium]|nr:glycosyltransferase [Acidobacteriota bacterium]